MIYAADSAAWAFLLDGPDRGEKLQGDFKYWIKYVCKSRQMGVEMKYVYQIGIIGGISLASEVLYVLLPLPVPASVYGLIILLALLLTGVVKLKQIEDTADFLLKIMPLLFIGPSVGLITAADAVKGQIIPLVAMCVLSTVGVMIVTSLTAQMVICRKKEKKGGKENAE